MSASLASFSLLKTLVKFPCLARNDIILLYGQVFYRILTNIILKKVTRLLLFVCCHCFLERGEIQVRVRSVVHLNLIFREGYN